MPASSSLYDRWYQLIHRAAHGGIPVCKDWQSDFSAFAQSLGKPPFPKAVLCLRDRAKGYCPGNTYWGSRRDRQKTVPHARIITANGQSKSISEWAEDVGVLRETIRKRLDTRPKDALSRVRLKFRRPQLSRGVYWRPTLGKWEGRFKHAGHNHYVGLFPWKKDAVAAVKRKRLELDAEAQLKRVRRNRTRVSRGYLVGQLNSLVETISLAVRACPTWAIDRRGKRTQTNHRRLRAS